MRSVARPAFCLSRGFTLIELVLVIGIIAVVSAIAVPRYARGVSRYRAEQAAQRIASDLNDARLRARLLGVTQQVQFTHRDAYSLTFDTAKWFDLQWVKIAQEPYNAQIVGSKFGAGMGVTFSTSGVPTSAGRVRVQSGDSISVVEMDDAGYASVVANGAMVMMPTDTTTPNTTRVRTAR